MSEPTGPVTKDGVPFVLGMTLWTGGGWSIPTSPETHEVETFEHDGRTGHGVGRKGSGMTFDLLGYYSSQGRGCGTWSTTSSPRSTGFGTRSTR